MKLFAAALCLVRATSAFAPARPFLRRASSLGVAVGDKIPSVNLHEGFPPDMVDAADYVKDKNMIIVGLPGAFTPT